MLFLFGLKIKGIGIFILFNLLKPYIKQIVNIVKISKQLYSYRYTYSAVIGVKKSL